MDFFENAKQKCTEGDANSLLPSDSSEQVFGAYTSSEFINVSKVMNVTNFFIFVPMAMQTYYWNIVRRNLEWYYGYVWGIHNNGVFATHTASKICKMSAQLTVSGGVRFEGTLRAEEFMDAFTREKRTVSKLKQKLPIHNAIGFTLAKIDIDFDGELDLNFVQGNRYFAQTDDEQRVLSFYAVVKVISADVIENGEGYYLVEERFYLMGAPVMRYRIYKGPVIATAPVFDGGAQSYSKGLSLEDVPLRVQRYIIKRFGRNILNKCLRLPFENIGAVIMLNTYCATGMDEYSCFSDSTIADSHAALYELDLTKTQKNESKYVCQDFVAMPDTMTPPERLAINDEQRAYALEMANNGFNKRIVKTFRNYDPSKAVPFVYQPQLKSDIYNNDISQILNEIAASCQFSPITLAGYLSNGSDKTATEVTADENATRLTIADKRTLIAEALNSLTKIILKHYKIVDDRGNAEECSVMFNEGSLSNERLALETLEIKQRNNWLSAKAALMQANPQFTRREAEEEQTQIMQESGGSTLYKCRNIDDIL